MSLFRRRDRATDDERPVGAEAEESTADDGVDQAWEGADDAEEADEDEGTDRSNGPWDVSERPDAEGYVDLGGIRLRGRDGMELRLELDESTGAVSSATIHLGRSAVQLQAFAAPRTEGIWGEIRAEIVAGIQRQGGQADEVPGPFGRELIARIPARSPDGRTGHTPARFVGIDGPRWFLRAVFHGEAVHRPEAAEVLEEVVREVVVVRGPEAMPPRELLPLRLPEAVGQPAEPEGENRYDLNPFERGPEITEVR
ncbi:MAG TPA: DUF3710 domain-containing protein [Kineosporiaceae bacterium]